MWAYLAVHIGRGWSPIMDGAGRPKWAGFGRPPIRVLDPHLKAQWTATRVDGCPPIRDGRPPEVGVDADGRALIGRPHTVGKPANRASPRAGKNELFLTS